MRTISFLLPLLLAVIFLPSQSRADSHPSWSGSRPDGHAPIGVMGEHVHAAGETMFSYRYMSMDMDGLRDGSSGVSEQSVLEDFMVTPTDMRMEMHMFGAMFAPSDRLTLMMMVPYLEIDMNHLVRNGRRFKTESSGLGDISLTGLVHLFTYEQQRFIFNAGVSLPSGEIDERDDTPAAENAKLPYPMQLGSGTVDLRPGLTYLGQTDRLSWGAQGIGTIRLGRNDNEYSLGDKFESTAWLATPLCENLSASVRSSWSIWGNVDGADPELNPQMVPTADANRRAGRRVELAAGINFYVPEGSAKNFRLGVEGILPVYESLDGPQLETDWSLVLGAQMSF